MECIDTTHSAEFYTLSCNGSFSFSNRNINGIAEGHQTAPITRQHHPSRIVILIYFYPC